MTELARVRAAMRRGQDWWRRVGVPTPLLVPTDLAGLAFGRMTDAAGLVMPRVAATTARCVRGC